MGRIAKLSRASLFSFAALIFLSSTAYSQQMHGWWDHWFDDKGYPSDCKSSQEIKIMAFWCRDPLYVCENGGTPKQVEFAKQSLQTCLQHQDVMTGICYTGKYFGIRASARAETVGALQKCGVPSTNVASVQSVWITPKGYPSGSSGAANPGDQVNRNINAATNKVQRSILGLFGIRTAEAQEAAETNEDAARAAVQDTIPTSDMLAPLREERWDDKADQLRALDPNDPELNYANGPGWVPSEAQLAELDNEIARVKELKADSHRQVFANLSDKATSHSQRVILDTLMPNGRPVGEVIGTSDSRWRTVSPDDFGRIEATFNSLGGVTATPPTGYDGLYYLLPQLGFYGIRESKAYGRTLDFNLPSVPAVIGVHFNPERAQ